MKFLTPLFKKDFPIVFCALILLFFVVTIVFSTTPSHQQFSYLAQSFLNGKLYFMENAGSLHDVANFNGHSFWPLGPFPALLLMPFMYIFGLVGVFFLQGYLQIFLVIAIFYFCFKLARGFNFSKNNSLYLAFAFTFASQFIGVAILPISWYFAHTVTVFLLFFALNEYFGKKRYWLIGLLMGFVALTRLTAGVGIIFFLMGTLFSPAEDGNSSKTKKFLQLIIPFIATLGLLGLYNYLRFGNFLEGGYSYQALIPSLSKARDYGLMSLVHVPGNLFYAFLSTPLPVFRDSISRVLQFPFLQANPWGTGIFVTSPYLLYLFFLEYKDRVSKMLLATIALIAIPIFLYYGIGYAQFGYRYALDFMPFLFLLFIRNYSMKHSALSLSLKILIIISAILNFYLYFTFLATISSPL